VSLRPIPKPAPVSWEQSSFHFHILPWTSGPFLSAIAIRVPGAGLTQGPSDCCPAISVLMSGNPGQGGLESELDVGHNEVEAPMPGFQEWCPVVLHIEERPGLQGNKS
jgi:hypothetical protein